LACSICSRHLPASAFHKKHQQPKMSDRACIACLDEREAEESMATCTACAERKPRSEYRKRVDWDHPTCRACLEEEESHLTCSACGERKWRSEFRKRIMDWDAPTCRRCLDAEEGSSSEPWQATDTQAEAVSSGGVSDLREVVEPGTVDGEGSDMREDFARHVESRWAASVHVPPVLWEERLAWGVQLAESIVAAESNGTLDPRWRRETPSREHASDKEAAEVFKAFEDQGDEIVYAVAMEFYDRFVAGVRTDTCRLCDLLAEAEAAGPRSLRWRGAVVASVRPEGGAWPEEVRGSLKPEPWRSDRGAPLADGEFAQFDHDARETIESLLDTSAKIIVKTYSADFWTSVEDRLYSGSVERGSHWQVLGASIRETVGASAGANRTESMNFFADLLGFNDPDPEKWANATHAIWKERFGHAMPPNALQVCYGSGGEFRADKKWKTKMEANVAEALIGALHAGGHQRLASAAAGLCFLSYIATPSAAPPSNWAMAARQMRMVEEAGEDWAESQRSMARLFDAAAFSAEMDACLRQG